IPSRPMLRAALNRSARSRPVRTARTARRRRVAPAGGKAGFSEGERQFPEVVAVDREQVEGVSLMHSNTHNAAEPSGSLTCEGGACGSATYPVEWNLIAITRVPSPEIRRNTIGSERASIDCGYSYPGNYFDLAV